MMMILNSYDKLNPTSKMYREKKIILFFTLGNVISSFYFYLFRFNVNSSSVALFI